MPGKGGISSENVAVIVLPDGTVERGTVIVKCKSAEWESLKCTVDERRKAGEEVVGMLFRCVVGDEVVQILFYDTQEKLEAKADEVYPKTE